MSPKLHTIIAEIPLEQIRAELPQPRKNLNLDKTKDDDKKSEDDKVRRLMLSLKEDGLGSAITMVRIGENSYQIINGHRRYKCAKLLGWDTIRCEIHEPFTDEGDMEKLRLNVQTNIDQWKPLERAAELERIKEKKKIKSNRDLAAYLHYPESLLSTSFKLQKRRADHQKLMDKYGLSEAYQNEFIKLFPKISPIREFTVEMIMETLFDRVQHQLIKSAKDFRKLASVFLRPHANEELIYEFLKNRDIRIDELYEKTGRSGFVRDVDQLMTQTAKKLNQGVSFSDDEKQILQDYFTLLKKSFSFA